MTRFIVTYNRRGKHVQLHTNAGGSLEQAVALANALMPQASYLGCEQLDIKAGNAYEDRDDRGRVIWRDGELTAFGKTVKD